MRYRTYSARLNRVEGVFAALGTTKGGSLIGNIKAQAVSYSTRETFRIYINVDHPQYNEVENLARTFFCTCILHNVVVDIDGEVVTPIHYGVI